MKANVLFIIFLIFLTSVFDTVNQLLLKTSINSLESNVNSIKKAFYFIAKLLFMPKIWLGFLFCCASLIVWLFALSKADLNFAFSADSMHYILIALTSRIFLKEKVGLWRWVGTFFIVIGIILLTYSNA
ncbi:MAG: hypothetical protein MUC39_02375 [Candidatus Omnitrophica bacterium]|nr:hypothetical protein [Candidatus Omnitrophota bacterium]